MALFKIFRCPVGGAVVLLSFVCGVSSGSTVALESVFDDGAGGMRLRQEFLREHPGARISVFSSSARVWGRSLGGGATAIQAAEGFRLRSAAMFGVEPGDLRPAEVTGGEGHTTPVLLDPETGEYRFTAVYFEQVRDEIPVYGSRMVVLVRNEPGYPVVLVNPDVRPLGAFHIDPRRANQGISPVALRLVKERFSWLSGEAPEVVQVVREEMVIWAGKFGEQQAPVLTNLVVLAGEHDRWLFLTDTVTGDIVHEEHRILKDGKDRNAGVGGKRIGVSGSVRGLVTTGIASDNCGHEVWTGLPYVPIVSEGRLIYTDETGAFSLPMAGSPVRSFLAGRWFEVINLSGPDLDISLPGTPFLLLGFNQENMEQERAQVNAYVEANRARDFALRFNPTYPMLDQGGVRIFVNMIGLGCPGNAFYLPSETAMFFCLAGATFPNTAWSSVVHHEYGHHLIEMAGSGQGTYGEGMSDSIAQLISDDPRLAVGFQGDCTTALRTGDNTVQFPCTGEIHECGQLISGCLWDTRNALALTHPDDYLDILSNLTINSILLHTGESIDPGIAIDFLTLDDNDANILNGTPHSAEIIAGFDAHNMIAPLSIELLTVPPDFVSPDMPQTLEIRITDGINDSLVPGSPRLHFRNHGGAYIAIPLVNLGNDLFEGELPASSCGSRPEYYFSAMNDQGLTILHPMEAPNMVFDARVSVPRLEIADNFEIDQGWTTDFSGATSGFWQRGNPVDDPEWEFDPVTDGDGSGQCWLTQNEPGNTDVDDGRVSLTSPILDMTGGEYLINYDYFLRKNELSLADTLTVRVNNNGGIGPWTKVVSHQTDGGLTWRHHEITQQDLNAKGVVMTANMRVRFEAFDGGIPSIVEAGVDGFRVVELVCDSVLPCPADCDPAGSDGVVDGADIQALLSAFGGDGSVCDVNGNGVVNIDDLVGLLNAFGACP